MPRDWIGGCLGAATNWSVDEIATVGSFESEKRYDLRWAIKVLIFSAAWSAACLTVILAVKALWIMFGTVLFMISVASGMTGNGTPYGSMEDVTSRNLICSRRAFMPSVLKPCRLPGFEPVQLPEFFTDHSGPQVKAMNASAALRSTVWPANWSLKM